MVRVLQICDIDQSNLYSIPYKLCPTRSSVEQFFLVIRIQKENICFNIYNKYLLTTFVNINYIQTVA